MEANEQTTLFPQDAEVQIVGEIPPYTMIYNQLITDDRLRLQTRMVLILMLSKPKRWNFSIRGMAKIAKVSKDTMSRMIGELEEAGYLKRNPQKHTDTGRFARAGFLISGQPIFLEEATIEKPCPKNKDAAVPCPNLSCPEMSCPENSPQENKEQENKEQENKEQENSIGVFQEAVSVLQDISVPYDVGAAQEAIILAMTQHGFSFQHKAPVERRNPNQNYGGSICILAAKGGITIAIAVDRKTPREKSIFKLRNFPCDFRIIVLRGGKWTDSIPGIDAVISVGLKEGNDLFSRFWQEYPKKVNKHYQAIAMSNTDAQFVESNEVRVADVCRFFGVPLHLVYAGKQSYSNNEQNGIEYVNYTLLGYETQWKQEDSYKLLLPSERAAGLRIKRELKVFLQGDTAAQAAWLRTMREIGGYNADEIRGLDDRPGIPGGHVYYSSLNFVPLELFEELSRRRAESRTPSD